MPNHPEGGFRNEQPDQAAIFTNAHSLWEYGENNLTLSHDFQGVDGFMREIMRVANLFENWACAHVAFDELNECWPYFLQSGFGRACFGILGDPKELNSFDDKDCLRVALQMRLPIRLDGELPLPVNFTVRNPKDDFGFREFRIQSVRDLLEGNDTMPFHLEDDPYDSEFSAPYFGFYGVNEDGTLEHIADRKTYSEAVKLAEKIAPGISFPFVFRGQS